MSEAILIIEDDATLRVTLSGFLPRLGFDVDVAEDAASGLAAARSRRYALVLLDLRLPDQDGLTLLPALREVDDDLLIVIMTAYPEVRTAVACLKAGAYDYINKPFDLEDLRSLLQRALETRRLRREVAWRRAQRPDADSAGMIGISTRFRELLAVTDKIAASGRVPALLRGESGTGKERIARTLHTHSPRKDGPWITLNCSALPEGLLESEIFGYEKGAFTDARQAKRGLLELADGGTFFLDEIGDLSLSLQPKLLRVLETQTFRRLGGQRELTVDIRFVAATHRDLPAMVAAGTFREDLYYRLNVGTISLPPLRERRDDILPLAQHFLLQVAPDLGRAAPEIRAGAAERLQAYDWPGNVRELRNVMERAAILCGDDAIDLAQLPAEVAGRGTSEAPAAPAATTANASPLRPLAAVELDYILQVLTHTGGNKTQAAEILGITRVTLRNKLREHDLDDEPANS